MRKPSIVIFSLLYTQHVTLALEEKYDPFKEKTAGKNPSVAQRNKGEC